MLMKLRLPIVVLGAALSFFSTAALARDHDRDDRVRVVRRERIWREHPSIRGHFYTGPAPYGYYGYYDRWGYWHPYRGYYRWGY